MIGPLAPLAVSLSCSDVQRACYLTPSARMLLPGYYFFKHKMPRALLPKLLSHVFFFKKNVLFFYFSPSMRTDSLYCSPLRLKMPYIFKTAGDRQDRVLTDEVTIQRIMAIRAMFIVLQAMKKHLTNGNLTDPCTTRTSKWILLRWTTMHTSDKLSLLARKWSQYSKNKLKNISINKLSLLYNVNFV